MTLSPEHTVEVLKIAAQVSSDLDKPGAKPNVPNYNESSTQVPKYKPYDNTPRCLKAEDRSITKLIGNTPLLRARKIEKSHGLKCKLWLKLEYMNPGGSVKDRPAIRMLERAEEEGICKPGDVILEATSGNMGVGLAVACAAKGYQLIVTMPLKMSQEKENVLRALGAIVVRTKTSASWDDANSHISIAYTIRDRFNAVSDEKFGGIKAHCLDQYQNCGNLDAHYNGTAAEIIEQLEGKVDMLVATVGTGGTGTGIATRMKAYTEKCKVIAVDPEGSILSYKKGEYDLKTMIKGYETEGIGYDFHPKVYHHDIFHGFFKSTDRQSFLLAREMIRTEGVLCGGSAGAALAGAIENAKDLSEDQNVVVIIPDSIRNYISKFVADDWMVARGIFEHPTEHEKYQPAPAPAKGAFKTSVARKVTTKHTVNEARKLLAEATKPGDHVAVFHPSGEKTGTLQAIHSRQDILLWILQGKGDLPLTEVINAPHSLFGFDNQNVDDQKSGEAKIALLSLIDSDAKFKNPALTVIPPQLASTLGKNGEKPTILKVRAALNALKTDDIKASNGDADYIDVIALDDLAESF